MKLAKSFNAKNLEFLGKHELEEETWKETGSDVAKGCLCLWNESGALDGKFLGKRLGIRQGPKIRVIDGSIDDCTPCGLNLTVGPHET